MNSRIIILQLIIVFTLYSCKTKNVGDLEEMARRSSSPEAVPVKTIKLEPSVFYHELISNGKTYSMRKAIVPFRVNGLIQELKIKNGQKVTVGELLAVIDDKEFSTGLQKARLVLDQAQLDFRNELISYYMTEDTSKLSESQVMNAKMRSGLIAAQITYREALYNYNNTRITAPIDGIIANLEARELNLSQNYKDLCTVISDETMEVEFPVIESEFGFISNGMPVGIIPFISDSITIPGFISQINPQVDENGMVKIKAEFRNNGKIIDGMNVRVLIRKSVPDRLVVPKEALVVRQGKDVIFVRQDSLAIWKYVTVEYENSKTVSIKEGLQPGDLVIVSGNVNLAHETIVQEQ
jgi:membrane fusion protein, multidrug efflux system